MSTVPNFLNFTSSLLMLSFVQPLFENSVTNFRALQPLHSYRFLIRILSSLLNGIKLVAFAYSVKIRVIFCDRFERRKVGKKQTYVKTETRNSMLQSFEYLHQMISKLILVVASYTVPKLVHFWDTVYVGVFGIIGSIGTIFKSKMAAGRHLNKFQVAISETSHLIYFMFGSRIGFWGRRIEWIYFRLN